MSRKMKKRNKRKIETEVDEPEPDKTPYEMLVCSLSDQSKSAASVLKKFKKKEESKESQIKSTDSEPTEEQKEALSSDEEISDTEELLEEEENEIDDSDEDSDDGSVHTSRIDQDDATEDPFCLHFESDLTEETVKILKNGEVDKAINKASDLGYVEHSMPKSDAPKSTYGAEFENADLANAKVKEKLIERWYKANSRKKGKGPFTELQNSLFNYVNKYQDVFYSQRDFNNAEEIRRLYCLHAVNHIYKTRSRILKNNAKIVQSQKDEKKAPECRDHGLTRPKVLILVPFRDGALRIVNTLIQLALPTDGKAQVMQKKRFTDEFKGEPDDAASSRYLPDDFKAMFNGNSDDCFRIGVAFMRRAVKLYADFYAADILIASPLGIRTIIGGEGEKHRDYDFLSSIEVLILDQADVFLMQNWEHVQDVFQHLHLQPKESHNTDFSRVRMWSLDSLSKFYRQTMMFSSFTTPELNSVYNKHFLNYAGKVKIKLTSIPGAVRQVVKQIPQVFHKIDSESMVDAADKRFDYFIKKVLPEFKGSLTSQTAIFIPSYFDFVRIRNYFKKEDLDFLQINEYSERSNISRSRTQFHQKKFHFLLFTERFYFFYRYRIRGIKHIIFYQLPLYPVFYPEIVNFMDTDADDQSESAMCTVLYNKYDSNRLESITGTQRCKQMLSSSKPVHMIVTGD